MIEMYHSKLVSTQALWYFGSIYFSIKQTNNRRQSKINTAFLCVSAPDSVACKVTLLKCKVKMNKFTFLPLLV